MSFPRLLCIRGGRRPITALSGSSQGAAAGQGLLELARPPPLLWGAGGERRVGGTPRTPQPRTRRAPTHPREDRGLPLPQPTAKALGAARRSCVHGSPRLRFDTGWLGQPERRDPWLCLAPLPGPLALHLRASRPRGAAGDPHGSHSTADIAR